MVENDIIDKQFVDTQVVNDYHHQHILRDMITDAKADFLAESPAKGKVLIKVYNYSVPIGWNENNMEVVTYAHEKDTKWDVLQTAIKSIK